MDSKESILTSAEWDVIDSLATAYNKFIKLEKLALNDSHMFSTGIDALHNIVMSRAVLRELQDNSPKTSKK